MSLYRRRPPPLLDMFLPLSLLMVSLLAAERREENILVLFFPELGVHFVVQAMVRSRVHWSLVHWSLAHCVVFQASDCSQYIYCGS